MERRTYTDPTSPPRNPALDTGTPRNGYALALYLIAVASAAFATPALLWSGNDHAPLTAVACTYAGAAAGSLAATAAVYGGYILRNRTQLFAQARLLWCRTLPLMVLSRSTDMALYSLAAGRVDMSTAIVLLETHPVLTIVLVAWNSRGNGTHPADLKRLALLLPVYLAGIMTLAAAETGGFTELFTAGAGTNTLSGIGLALAGTLSMGLGSLIFRWSHEAAWSAQSRLEELIEHRHLACITLSAMMITSLALASAILYAAGTAAGESLSTQETITGLTVAGAGIFTLSGVAWRWAMIQSERATLLTTLYLITPAALTVQAALGLVQVPRPEYLAIAAAAVIIAGAASNIRRRPGF